MTNGAGSPANNFVFFSIIPEITIAVIPTKYAEGATHQAPPNNAVAIRAMIGSFAPQGMKVVVIIVIRRSRSFSMVRDAIMPGTPHPVPISMGIKDFPLRPNLRKIRSMTNAIRAIYPQDSKNANRINSTSIWGTNPSTAPTPPTMPSNKSPLSHSGVCKADSAFSTSTGIPGTQPRKSDVWGKLCAFSPSAASYIGAMSYPAFDKEST